MKTCFSCGNMLSDEAAYCYLCNTPQTQGFNEFEAPPKHDDIFLKVLCWLTVAGALLSFTRIFVALTDETTIFIPGFEVVIYLSIVVAIGKLTGAIFMLLKKMKGLYIYTVAAIFAIANQIYSAYISSDYIESSLGNNSTINMISVGFVIVFFLAFLIMYWLPVNRRLLS